MTPSDGREKLIRVLGLESLPIPATTDSVLHYFILTLRPLIRFICHAPALI